MDMRNQPQRRFRVSLRRTGGYRFADQATEDGRPHGDVFHSDEPDPVGAASAPSTPALVAAAVGHCLSASLLEALQRARLEVLDLKTEVVSVVAPNSSGLPRIDHLEVTIS